ncbi:hypothetical protein ACFC0D_03490 [Streptomyces sp. NPDC056222]|uniref:hypothetical protein n=1 Tax=Streptomyces sp. NPDC056222 TaxID=3345749 RepID=UPI0035DD6BD1
MTDAAHRTVADDDTLLARLHSLAWGAEGALGWLLLPGEAAGVGLDEDVELDQAFPLGTRAFGC